MAKPNPTHCAECGTALEGRSSCLACGLIVLPAVAPRPAPVAREVVPPAGDRECDDCGSPWIDAPSNCPACDNPSSKPLRRRRVEPFQPMPASPPPSLPEAMPSTEAVSPMAKASPVPLPPPSGWAALPKNVRQGLLIVGAVIGVFLFWMLFFCKRQ